MGTEFIGGFGTTLVLIAYVPQLRHLYVEKCAWGISVSTWWIWLAASLLLLVYSALRGDPFFLAAQGVNAAAVVATLVLTRRSIRVCPHHCAPSAQPVADGSHLDGPCRAARGWES
jgi:uncharacterized protein with PQ loop repeat